MFSVSFGVTFQSSCAKKAHADFSDEMKLLVEICPLEGYPNRNDAIPSPVALANSSCGLFVRFRPKNMSPWGDGTWKNGNLIGRNSPPNFNAWLPRLIETFWMKSHTLLYSFVGSQSEAPIPFQPR